MSTKTVSDREDPVIETRDQLIAAIAKGEKPKDRWRIGTEHEKFVYNRTDHHAPSYDEPGGIRDTLDALAERFGWQRTVQGDNTIGLVRSGSSITLEPGGLVRLPFVEFPADLAQGLREAAIGVGRAVAGDDRPVADDAHPRKRQGRAGRQLQRCGQREP